MCGWMGAVCSSVPPAERSQVRATVQEYGWGEGRKAALATFNCAKY